MPDFPNHIISTLIGGKTQYVFNAPFGPDNIRRPVYVADIEKARRFWTTGDAHNYITRFANSGKTVHNIEEYRPSLTTASTR